MKDTRSSFISNRGYTGHEHLDAFNIINMNGRVYDPVTAQFFSPDPFTQSPGDWMNYNGYSYVMNNPTRYTDPSGCQYYYMQSFVDNTAGNTWGALLNGGVSVGSSWENSMVWGGDAYSTDGAGNYFNEDEEIVSFEDIYNNFLLPLSSNDKVECVYVDGLGSKYGFVAGFQLTNGQTWNTENGLDAFGKILNGLKGDPQGNPQKQGSVVVDNTLQAVYHYFYGDGSPVRIGPNTTKSLLSSPEFLKNDKMIKSGRAKPHGEFSVDMTNRVFHIGRTTVGWSINSDNNRVTYNLYINDGFWDPDFIDEKYGGNTLHFKPDGLGPNLERFGGTPYKYIPTIVTFPF